VTFRESSEDFREGVEAFGAKRKPRFRGNDARSLMDYRSPRVDTLPFLATALSEVAAPSNRLGVRSGGEGGTTPALAAVINAIVDALAELGVRHIEMPATPERVWHAIRAEGSTAAATS
jgi:carbon-monoxide dehydrogenase large subunit